MEDKRGEKKKKKKKMMVVIDESETSYNSFIWVLENLKDLIESSKLYVLATQPSPVLNLSVFPAPFAYAQIYCPFSPTAELTRLAQEKSMKVSWGLLEKAKRICGSQGIKAETITEAGEPKEVICRAIQEHKIDLLVLGYQEHGFLTRFFRGSLNKYCLDNANCSVLVVKQETEQ